VRECGGYVETNKEEYDADEDTSPNVHLDLLIR